MRRIVTLGCCALYLTFGSVAGLAHVHESDDHHEASLGLHLDHGHLSEPGDHDPRHEHHHDQPHVIAFDDEAQREDRHADHHDCDALYLNATAARSLESGVRLLPAIVSVGNVIDPPSLTSNREDVGTGQPRDPPRKFLPRLRAPPA